MMSAINASEPLATMLLQRGIKDFDSARQFFNPSQAQLHPPQLMKDMDKAVERITDAVNAGENILVYGDYDVDGTTAVSLLYSFLSESYENVSFYIPDRYDEGYGVSMKSIDFAVDNDVKLVIALDCGIKALKQVSYAREQKIDFIICDHHLPGETLPEAFAILNPLQKGCDYPYKSLSGCAIGFKLVQALCKAWDLDPTTSMAYLDLVAIAAACDIVAMTGENRVLTHLGLNLMQHALRPGLALLLENGGAAREGELTRTLSVSDLVFVLGPRINAAGRMEHGRIAVELLTAQTKIQAEGPAAQIVESNKSRREVDQQMLEEALGMLDKENAEAKSTVLYAEHWHKGVVGIVASRVQDHYYRPTIILTNSNGKVTGSARSVGQFDVHEAIEACAPLLENYGGHPAAAGMTLAESQLDEFKVRFEEEVAMRIKPEDLIPAIEIDLELDFSQINQRFYDSMMRMAPFGPRNMRPLFVTHGVIDSGRSRPVGDGTHLKLDVHQVSNPRAQLKGIAFGQAGHHERMKSGEPFSLVYTLEMNEFNGSKNIELMVRDIKFIAS